MINPYRVRSHVLFQFLSQTVRHVRPGFFQRGRVGVIRFRRPLKTNYVYAYDMHLKNIRRIQNETQV